MSRLPFGSSLSDSERLGTVAHADFVFTAKAPQLVPYDLHLVRASRILHTAVFL